MLGCHTLGCNSFRSEEVSVHGSGQGKTEGLRGFDIRKTTVLLLSGTA
jgi:hypothetical protein